ncbi:MAG TPA: hypothetical protein VHV27_06155 [Phenylobacterium sp.]|nr:hypothetical protein [Phenylobacterium sp.]
MKKLPANRRLAVLAACFCAIAPAIYLLMSRQAEHTGAVNWVTFGFGVVVGLSFTLAIGLTLMRRRRS